jgi:antitoxin ParD1/3/4
MSRNTSILINDYYSNFINSQIESGKFSSVSEVVRNALRLFEEQEQSKARLIYEIELGENSPKIRNFDGAAHLKKLEAGLI